MGTCTVAVAHAVGDLIVMVLAGFVALVALLRARKIRQLEQERDHLEAALDACTGELIRLARGRDIQ